MSDGYNKPQYHATRSVSKTEPMIGDAFEWEGHTLTCVTADHGCSGCFFNYRQNMTEEHKEARAKACLAHFCEEEDRSDGTGVRFVTDRV